MSKSPCRLLLIEPDPGDAELASRILTQALEGCQVCIAPDAISYAEYFAVGGFSTVISELELGWSSGTEILASFAQRHPGTRLILYTSKLPPDIERLRSKIGLAGYAEKSSAGFLRLPDLANATPEDEPSHEGGEILWTRTIEQLEEPSLTVMKDGRILEANRSAARVFGYPKPDDLLGLRLSGLFDSTRHTLPEDNELAGQLRTLGLEDCKRLELMVAPVRDPLRVGRKRLVGWSIPNSPRIAVIYHTLAHSGTKIISTKNGDHQQAYTQLLYAVSHDLQEPLQLISRHAKLLQDAYSNELNSSGARFIGNLVNNSIQMQSMLDDLLEFSRLGRMAPVVNLVDVNAVVREVVAMYQPRLEEIAGRVRCTRLPKIVADRGQMVRLFQNLIGNAIKFHSDEPLVVLIGARVNGDSLELVVKDNGIGFDPSKSNAIFGMFKRLHTQDEYPGNGMGLAVCRRIVDLQGGKIWARARTKPKRGAAFYITLPMNGPQIARTPADKPTEVKTAS